MGLVIALEKMFFKNSISYVQSSSIIMIINSKKSKSKGIGNVIKSDLAYQDCNIVGFQQVNNPIKYELMIWFI